MAPSIAWELTLAGLCVCGRAQGDGRCAESDVSIVTEELGANSPAHSRARWVTGGGTHLEALRIGVCARVQEQTKVALAAEGAWIGKSRVRSETDTAEVAG